MGEMLVIYMLKVINFKISFESVTASKHILDVAFDMILLLIHFFPVFILKNVFKVYLLCSSMKYRYESTV